MPRNAHDLLNAILNRGRVTLTSPEALEVINLMIPNTVNWYEIIRGVKITGGLGLEALPGILRNIPSDERWNENFARMIMLFSRNPRTVRRGLFSQREFLDQEKLELSPEIIKGVAAAISYTRSHNSKRSIAGYMLWACPALLSADALKAIMTEVATKDEYEQRAALNYIFWSEGQDSHGLSFGDAIKKLDKKQQRDLFFIAFKAATTSAKSYQSLNEITQEHLDLYAKKYFDGTGGADEIADFFKIFEIAQIDILIAEGNQEWLKSFIKNLQQNAKSEEEKALINSQLKRGFIDFINSKDWILPDQEKSFDRYFRAIVQLLENPPADISAEIVASLTDKTLLIFYQNYSNSVFQAQIIPGVIERIEQSLKTTAGKLQFIKTNFLHQAGEGAIFLNAGVSRPTWDRFKGAMKIDPNDAEFKREMRQQFSTFTTKESFNVALEIVTCVQFGDGGKEIHDPRLSHLPANSVEKVAFFYDCFPHYLGIGGLHAMLENENLRQVLKDRMAVNGGESFIEQFQYFSEGLRREIADPRYPDLDIFSTFGKILELVDEKITEQQALEISRTATDYGLSSVQYFALHRAMIANNPDLQKPLINEMAKRFRKSCYETVPRSPLNLKVFFEQNPASEVDFISALDEFTLPLAYQYFSESGKAAVAKKVGAYTENYGLGVILYVAELRRREGMRDIPLGGHLEESLTEKQVGEIMDALYKMRKSLNLSLDDKYIDEALLKFFSRPIYKLDEIMFAANNDKSAAGQIVLSTGINVSDRFTLSKVKDALVVCRFYPTLMSDDVIGRIVKIAGFVEVLNNNLNYAHAKYFTKEACELFGRINAAIPRGQAKIETTNLLSIEALLKIKAEFPTVKPKANPDVSSLAAYKAIKEKTDFDTFFEQISAEERTSLGIYKIDDEGFEEVKRWLEEQIKILERDELGPIKDVTFAENPKDFKRKSVLKNLIEEAKENFINPQQDWRETLTKNLRQFKELKSADEQKKFPQHIKNFLQGIDKIESTQLIKKNWFKIVKNSEVIIKVGDFAQTPEEFFASLSSSMALVTQANCPANLALNLQKNLESLRYKNPQHTAYALALYEAAQEFLNSGGDMIGSSKGYEELFGNAEDQHRGVKIPLISFCNRIGEHLEQSQQAPDAQAAESAENDDTQASNYEQMRIEESIKRGRAVLVDLKLAKAQRHTERPRAQQLSTATQVVQRG